MTTLTPDQVKNAVLRYAAGLPASPRRVLLIPPDITRLHSGAGPITAWLYEHFSRAAQVDILPALGTHVPMSTDQLRHMFGPDIPLDRFLVHNWRTDLAHLGSIEGDVLREVSSGRVDYAMEVAVNRRLVEGGYDLIFSIGQIVPHEVIGMAGYTKNLCIGVGGADMINKSHFLGAVCNMEAIMGRADTPVRRVIDLAFQRHLAHLPIHFVLTVVQQQAAGDLATRGVFCGQDRSTFERAAALAREANITLLPEPIQKAVVWLDPAEYRSTWLGNKAVYRLRMAMADRGELIILAPGLKEFGEDPTIDRLIRKYGYRGTQAVLYSVGHNPELHANLSAAAHLIHGSSEGRFRITYCPGPGMSRADIVAAGFEYLPFAEAAGVYDPASLKDGWNTVGNERIFFVRNPSLGLWALQTKETA